MDLWFELTFGSKMLDPILSKVYGIGTFLKEIYLSNRIPNQHWSKHDEMVDHK
jgi:hypothetical protein